MPTRNLFADAEAPLAGERFDTLLAHQNLHIERIVSSATAHTDTCVQTQDEWVVLIQGEAELQVADTTLTLTPGDHVFLPAGTPHAVKRTRAGTLWLAVHLHPESTPPAAAAGENTG